MFSSVETAVNHLVYLCHSESFAAGWWTGKDGKHLLENPLAVSNKLMLMVTELAEACEGDRKNLMDDKIPNRKSIEVELADCVIRLADLAGALKLDLGGAITAKMAFNRQREDHKLENRSKVGGKSY